jgi:sirohydrochlorin ferrochelatase
MDAQRAERAVRAVRGEDERRGDDGRGFARWTRARERGTRRWRSAEETLTNVSSADVIADVRGGGSKVELETELLAGLSLAARCLSESTCAFIASEAEGRGGGGDGWVEAFQTQDGSHGGGVF